MSLSFVVLMCLMGACRFVANKLLTSLFWSVRVSSWFLTKNRCDLDAVCESSWGADPPEVKYMRWQWLVVCNSHCGRQFGGSLQYTFLQQCNIVPKVWSTVCLPTVVCGIIHKSKRVVWSANNLRIRIIRLPHFNSDEIYLQSLAVFNIILRLNRLLSVCFYSPIAIQPQMRCDFSQT